MHATLPLLAETDFPGIERRTLETVQVNVGYRCNQACLHCHVNAAPHRKETMDGATAEQVLAYLEASGAHTLDITGGAPELNAHFRTLVRGARALGAHVIDRCNLTVLLEPGQEGLADFLAAHGVEVVASLPCYLAENVEAQRGAGVYEASVAALRALNARGYAREGSGLVLNLVYNPQGPMLPPPQDTLAADYERELAERFGIAFDRLLTLANMPIQRFGSTLISRGQFQEYMTLLHGAHRDDNLEHVMCRSLISIDWRGYVYDCDFNQMLGLPLGGARTHLTELMGEDLDGRPIAVADHCYGCTAGQGSGCGGALSSG
ncbi:MAG: radical SAM/Cys-rich domain protein [Gammaproteobacteria bacterium]|nr:radical SAM/Cys-rich domain protein [Gammaproteobacteria bacterium]